MPATYSSLSVNVVVLTPSRAHIRSVHITKFVGPMDMSYQYRPNQFPSQPSLQTTSICQSWTRFNLSIRLKIVVLGAGGIGGERASTSRWHSERYRPSNEVRILREVFGKLLEAFADHAEPVL